MSMRTELARAKTLRVTFNTKVTGPALLTAKGSLLVDANNRVRHRVRMSLAGHTTEFERLSDGRRSVMRQDGETIGEPRTVPSNFADDFKAALSTAGLLVTFTTVRLPPLDHIDLASAIEFEKHRFVRTERLEESDAHVIDFALSAEYFGEGSGTLWIDARTQLPLKRVFRVGEGRARLTVLETYESIRLDEPIDPGEFRIP